MDKEGDFLQQEQELIKKYKGKACYITDLTGLLIHSGSVSDIHIDYFTKDCKEDPEMVIHINEKLVRLPLNSSRICLY